MRKSIVFAPTLLALFLCGVCFAGELADKAEHYGSWTPTWHRLGYGAIAETFFTDEGLTEVDRFGGRGDATMWTGTYLASQAVRYMATGDPEAHGEILSTIETLHHHLHVTGKCGFIARYRGPDAFPFNEGCPDDEHCYQAQGAYEGDIFMTNTSRDQYIGWFFGMATAFDAIDDVEIRAMIAEDVTEIVDAMIAQHWWIYDLDGAHTTAGPNVMPIMRTTWCLAAAHITGEERFWAAYEELADPSMHMIHRLGNISFMNKYTQHYGNNLGHTNMFTLMRLARDHDLTEDYTFWRELFLGQNHRAMHLVHNAWFELVHWSVLDEPDEEMRRAVIDDLTLFRDAPNVRIQVDPPCTPLDSFSVWMDGFQDENPWIRDLIGDVDPQAKEPYPVDQQCPSDFLWQRNMWAFECGSANLMRVYPGTDYLLAYWMARYLGVIDASY